MALAVKPSLNSEHLAEAPSLRIHHRAAGQPCADLSSLSDGDLLVHYQTARFAPESVRAPVAAEIIERFHHSALAVAMRILRNHHNAEYAASEGLEEVLLRIDQYNGVGSARSWMLAIVHHRAIDLIRRDRDRNHGVLSMNLMEESFAERSHPKSREGDPLETLINREQLDLTKHTLSTLPSTLRETAELYAAGLKYREIAEEQGIPEGTVKSRMNKVHHVLRAAGLG